MTAQPSKLRPSPSEDSSKRFEPYASFRFPIEDFGYVGEEWIAEGTEAGGSYATTVLVRLPRDRSRFSGTVIVEPLHFSGIAPISLYSSTYMMRSGHAWVMVASQRTTLHEHVKPHSAERYADLHIDGPDFPIDAQPGRSADADSRRFWDEMERANRASSQILAQAGAAIGEGAGPFEGLDVGRIILAGHSQTGNVVIRYLREAHEPERRPDGSSIYDGYFPAGFPFEAFAPCEVPIIQIVSDGDVSDPGGTFIAMTGRPYRRDDNDAAADRFRLYELAGVPHMGTRYAPFNDVELWRGMDRSESFTDASVMNTLPHNELFNMALHHLVEWIGARTTPPHAPRLELGADGLFVADDHGNTSGGVRCVQMDVPRARYFPNVPNPDGSLSHSTVGTEEPFSTAKLRDLYADTATYRERFERRLEELIGDGWLLADDAEYMLDDLAKVQID
jgi:hypothetical protein